MHHRAVFHPGSLVKPVFTPQHTTLSNLKDWKERGENTVERHMGIDGF